MNKSKPVKRISLLLTALLLAEALLFAVPDTPWYSGAFAAFRSRKTWGGTVSDKQLNRYNGKSYYWKLPGQNMYACVGYAEWVMNEVYKVKPRVANHGIVRKIRNDFVSRNTKMVAYGRYVSKKKGGDGKFHKHGEIRPGDIVFFFRRGQSNGRFTMKPIGKRKNADISGLNQWSHIAVVSGKGDGIDAKLHDNSLNNPCCGIACFNSIRKILKMYNGTDKGATDYQVFRVLKTGKQKVRFRAVYKKNGRLKGVSGIKIRIRKKTLKTGPKGKTKKTRALVRYHKYKVRISRIPSGYRLKGKKTRTVKITPKRKVITIRLVKK